VGVGVSRDALVGALVLIAVALPSGRVSAQQTPPDTGSPVVEARRLFEEGMAELQAERPGAAAERFETSLALSPRAATAFNLALALRDAERPREAWRVVDRLLDGAYGVVDDDRRPDVERLRDDLAARLAELEVRLAGAPRARLTIDGDDQGELAEGEARTTMLAPGTHELVAAVEDGPSLEERIELTAGERARVLFNVTTGHATVDQDGGAGDGGGASPWLWVGLGGAVLVAGAVVLAVVLASDGQPTVDDVWGRHETLRF